MAEYPTYSQMNKTDGYSKPVSEVGGRLRSPAVDEKNDCRDQVLDLSGKPGCSSVAMVTGRQWISEQDAALDLSSHGKPMSGQAEALDLSKRSTPPVRSSLSQSHPVSVGILQSHHPLPSHKLLEKALTSGLSSSDFQLGPLSTSHTVSRQSDRNSADFSDSGRSDFLRRTYESLVVKPFSSSGYKPVGLSMPQVTLPNAGTRLVHAQKPIAITTPQPHNSSVNTSKQSETSVDISANRVVSGQHSRSIPNVVSSQSYQSSSSRPVFNVQNMPFSTPGYIIQRPGSGHGMPTSFGAAIDDAVERCVVRRPENEGNFQDNTNNKNGRTNTQLGFACPACPKVFKSKAAMKLHMTVHKTSAERQFVCGVCQRRFLHRHHLIVHQRKHSGEKPYKCNACSKSFMAVFLLHKHLRKHTREQGQSNEISSEQLKQLNDRKANTNRSEGADGIGFGGKIKTEKPDLVIVSDEEDESVLDVRASTDDRRRSEEQIRICSDASFGNDSVYSSALTGLSCASENVADNSAKPEIKSGELKSVNANVEITNIEIKSNSVKILASSVKEKDGNGVKTKLVIKEIEYDTSFDSARTHEYMETKNKYDATWSEGICINNSNEINHHIPETLISKCENQDVSNVNNKTLKPITEQSEVIDPWPKYSSDDETELDYLTGELKVLNKTETQSKTCTPESRKIKTDHQPEDMNFDRNFDPEKRSEMNSDKDSPETKQNDHLHQNQVNEIKEITKTHKRNVRDGETEMDSKRLKLNEADNKQDIADSNSNSSVTVAYPNSSCNGESNIDRKAKLKRNKGKKKLKRFKCETCSRNFYSQHHLLLHMNTHKKNPALDSLKKAKANQINVAFAQKSGFTCSVCYKNFMMQKGLNSHMRIHSSKLAENKLLSRKFRDFLKTKVMEKSSKDNSENLKQEISLESQVHETQLSSFSSKKSEVTFTDGDKALNNQSVISPNLCSTENDSKIEDNIQVIFDKDKNKRYVCHACNNTYTTKQKLKMHALIHKDNCYLCDMCGKSFFREVTLQKHISTHMLPRPHVCIICRKSFIHRSSLMRHKAVHEMTTVPSVKQQPDFQFELEMRDTYAMLQKERLEILQKEKIEELKIDAPATNQVVMDLSIHRRNDQLTQQRHDENLQPPKLSPMTMTVSATSPSVSFTHLSPPNITKEPVQMEGLEKTEIKEEAEMPVERKETQMKMLNVPKRSRIARSFYQSNDTRQQSVEELNRPRQRRRKSRVYPTSCRICKEIFPNVIGLKAHMSVHNSVETHLYECNVCGHRFTQSCSLLRHMKTSCDDSEAKLNKLQCNTCEKIFQRRNAYDRHMDSHINGEPPKLNVSLHDIRSDEVETTSPRLYQASINSVPVSSEIKQEIQTDLDMEEFHKVDTIPEKSFITEDEVSEAETIPYGKTSSDESNDGFSDSSETETDQEQPRAQSLPPNNSSLSLLSEVCSSLISIEKEAEMKKQNELISVQKELETIDILARLSRQNAWQKIKTENQTFDLNSVTKDNQKNTEEQVYPVQHLPGTLIPKQEPIEIDELVNNVKVEDCKSDKIPTVVTDIESEAEKRRRNYFIRMQQRILEGTPRSLQPLTAPSVCIPYQQKPSFKTNSLLAAALFDKGKSEPTTLFHPPTNPFSSALNPDMPTDLSMKKKNVQINPLDLSPRSSPLLRETLMSVPTSSSKAPQPPPLVSVFKCPNCGRLLYNKSDYRNHMRGHGISPPDSPPQYAQVHPQGPLQSSSTSPSLQEAYDNREAVVSSAGLATDYTDIKVPSTSSWTSVHVKKESDHMPSESSHHVIPPSTLSISPRKYGPIPLAIPSTSRSTPSHSVASTPDLDSPVYSSSDVSDIASSPVGSVSLNTDILRKELRNKIYARRKSQGLEELTVEFKAPEKTEMTPEELEKLQHRRESNRQAAQRSRMRKKDRIISLLEELHQEESVLKSIRRQMEIMENEKKALLSILENHECVMDKHS